MALDFEIRDESIREWAIKDTLALFDKPQFGAKVVIGPHPRGAQLILPPGVVCRTPEEVEQAYNQEGWRHGIWRATTGGEVEVNRFQDRKPILKTGVVFDNKAQLPERLETISLPIAASILHAVGSRAIDAWIRDEAAKYGRSLLNNLKAVNLSQLVPNLVPVHMPAELAALTDNTENAPSMQAVVSHQDKVSNQYTELQLDAALAFGEEWVKENAPSAPQELR